MSAATVCPASADGRHRVAHAHAEVCYFDDAAVNVDIDVICGLCGASGHTVLDSDYRMLEWEDDGGESGGA